jgi:hypothetical protein
LEPGWTLVETSVAPKGVLIRIDVVGLSSTWCRCLRTGPVFECQPDCFPSGLHEKGASQAEVRIATKSVQTRSYTEPHTD